MSTPKILIIDDDRDIRLLLNRFLTQKGYEVSEAGSASTARQAVKGEQFDLVISDHKLPDGNGLDLSKELITIHPDLPVIMITAYSDVKMAVKAVKRGIFDYITKPLHPDELLNTIERALKEKKTAPSPQAAEPSKSKHNRGASSAVDYIAGTSQAASEVNDQIALVGPTDMSVIILGETGAGKEFAAKEIHLQSKRSDKPFVALDCGALSDEIAGSELFGHVKGAFTGALADKVGSFEYANGGTIFLDEIGNLSVRHQVKLLRVVQESAVKRIGANKEIPINVRIIVATNEDLNERISKGEFRKDLYFRLNEFTIKLPPLRDREEDIMLFAERFMALANDSLDKNVKKISKKAQGYICSYPWYGNLREMRNVMKRAVLLTEGSTLKASSLPSEIRVPSSYFLKKSISVDQEHDLKAASQNAEHEMILDALKKTGNNKSKAAELLNIDRKTLYNKLKQFELDS